MKLPDIKSRMILGATANADTLKELRAKQKLHRSAELNFSVFETTVGTKTVYCCWAGGRLNDKAQPELTLVGKGALEALCNLPDVMPIHKPSVLIFAGVALGKTPLTDKVKERILEAPENAIICFVGDLAKELDGHMSKAFGLTGEPIFIGSAERIKHGV